MAYRFGPVGLAPRWAAPERDGDPDRVGIPARVHPVTAVALRPPHPRARHWPIPEYGSRPGNEREREPLPPDWPAFLTSRQIRR